MGEDTTIPFTNPAFRDELSALFGESVKGLSPAMIAWLKGVWEHEHALWR